MRLSGEFSITSPCVSSSLGATGSGLGAESAVQFLAIGQHDLYDPADVPASLHRLQSDRNLLSDLHGLLCPTSVDHARRSARLYDPMHHLALIIFDIELDQAVRIGPEPVRHSSLDRSGFFRLERRGAVVCEQWSCNNQDANNHKEKDGKFISHR